MFFFNEVGENQSRFSFFEALELVSDQRSQHTIAPETQNLIDFTPFYRLICVFNQYKNITPHLPGVVVFSEVDKFLESATFNQYLF